MDPSEYAKGKLRDGFDVDGSGPYTLKAEVKKRRASSRPTSPRTRNYKGELKAKQRQGRDAILRGRRRHGSALDKGDIDLMTRAHVAGRRSTSLDDAAAGDVNLIEMPGLEIRYLGFNTNAPPVKTRPSARPMAQVIDRSDSSARSTGHRPTRCTRWSRAASPATPTRSSTSTATRASPQAGRPLNRAGIDHPGEADPAPTRPTTTVPHRQEFEVLQKQLNASGLFDVNIKGVAWAKFRPASDGHEYAVYGMGWFPDFPDADNYIAPFLDKDNFLGSPYGNSSDPAAADPGVPPRADRSAAARRDFTTDPGHRRRRRTGAAAVAGQAVRRRPRRHHGSRVGAQLLLDAPAVGARPRRERLTRPYPTAGPTGRGRAVTTDEALAVRTRATSGWPPRRGGTGRRLC